MKSKKSGIDNLVVVRARGFKGESWEAITSSKQVIVNPFTCFNNVLAREATTICNTNLSVARRPSHTNPGSKSHPTDSLCPPRRQIRTTRQMTATTRSARDARCQCSRLGGGAACSRAGRPPERSGQPPDSEGGAFTQRRPEDSLQAAGAAGGPLGTGGGRVESCGRTGRSRPRLFEDLAVESETL